MVSPVGQSHYIPQNVNNPPKAVTYPIYHPVTIPLAATTISSNAHSLNTTPRPSTSKHPAPIVPSNTDVVAPEYKPTIENGAKVSDITTESILHASTFGDDISVPFADEVATQEAINKMTESNQITDGNGDQQSIKSVQPPINEAQVNEHDEHVNSDEMKENSNENVPPPLSAAT